MPRPTDARIDPATVHRLVGELLDELTVLDQRLARLARLADATLGAGGDASPGGPSRRDLDALRIAAEEYGQAYAALRRRALLE